MLKSILAATASRDHHTCFRDDCPKAEEASSERSGLCAGVRAEGKTTAEWGREAKTRGGRVSQIKGLYQDAGGGQRCYLPDIQEPKL